MTMQSIKQQLVEVRGQHLTHEQLAQKAIILAESLLRDAKAREKSDEHVRGQKIAGMMTDAAGKALTLTMADQIFRSHDPRRIANQLLYLVHGYGIPKYLPQWERLALGLGAIVGNYLPQVVVPFVTAKLRQETQAVILPGEEKALRNYLAKRRATGTRLNLNQLGEAILGEGEAKRRLSAYFKLLERPDVEYISIKMSSVCSQLNMVAFDKTLATVKERLRELYRVAMQHQFRLPNGKLTPKFINLDMEEYRDLHLTADAFQQVLDEPEFQTLRAGIVLQAYLPDSFPMQQQLTEWALKRAENGGASIKIRVVKGANLAMEQAEASLHNWPQAPYPTKVEVDANFKRMVIYGCQPERAKIVNLGIASHNLFDVAYAMLLRAINQVEAYVEFEMLEGMANHQARTVQATADGLLLYAPVVKKEDFHSAIAYLVRRLDENTAEENFLRDLFDMVPGTPAWDDQRTRFLEACHLRDTVSAEPRRTQNRATEQYIGNAKTPFLNAIDTDWALTDNQQWVKTIIDHWQTVELASIPLQIGGEFIHDGNLANGHDPSRPNTVPYQYELANAERVEQALTVAVDAQADWANRPVIERKKILVDVATAFSQARGHLLGAMTLDGGKAASEADPEISEAIDFASYYARSFDMDGLLDDCQISPLGTVLVTPPWNFPLAIPMGGCLAALIAGNTVIFKPAPEAMLVGWEAAKLMWQAGIPKSVLQFVPCPDNEVGQSLVTDDRVNAVILTGAKATANLFQGWKPHLNLMAETSGKNSLIITGLADHDQAIKDLVRSAFAHAGQKCSAASLAICEAEVYDNPDFLRQLKDAVQSLHVGSAWEIDSKVTPIIRPPGPELERGLTTLEPGEQWLLKPHMVDNNPCLWSPGIKLGVQPESFFHKTECFGPVLGLMRAENLAEAIQLANAVDFGLTGGIHSLDKREVDYYLEHIEVGNVYINRHITGAIVKRQPFGGWKTSAVGPGAKAGGPNYVFQMAHWSQDRLPKPQAEWSPAVAALLERCLTAIKDPAQNLAPADQTPQADPKADLLRASAGSYALAWQTHFNQVHDPSQIVGETNYFRYQPCRGILFRGEAEVDPVGLCQVVLAARTCSAKLTLSLPSQAMDWYWFNQIDFIHIVLETEAELIARLHSGQYHYDRFRAIHPISTELRQAVNQANLGVVETPILANGRLELRYYLREQAISHIYHRYGNVIPTP